MNKLKEVTTEELEKYLPENEVHSITKLKEPLFVISNVKGIKRKATDTLIDVEIVMRRCKRVGMFD